MRRSSTLCCDANVVVRLVTRSDGGVATDLWRQWREDQRAVIAPQLLRHEVTNALHRLRIAGGLSATAVGALVHAAFALPISYAFDETLHLSALRLAARFNRPATYDAHYLALAERENAEFWTADRRLFSAVRHELPWVHLVDS
jgi:predicted nucleic acid-binding protein